MMRVEEIEEIRLFKEAVKRSSSEYIRLVRTTYVEDIEKLFKELDELTKAVKDLSACHQVCCTHCPHSCRHNIQHEQRARS